MPDDLTPNWPTSAEPRWRLRDALAWLAINHCSKTRRVVFAAKWILLRGRSIKVGTAKLTFNDQPTIKPLQWGIEDITISGKKFPGVIVATMTETCPPKKLEWLRHDKFPSN